MSPAEAANNAPSPALKTTHNAKMHKFCLHICTFRDIGILVDISFAPQFANRKPKRKISVNNHAKRAQQPEILQIHEYYTSNSTKLQGFLVIFTIFVDYAHFYVNMVMLTVQTSGSINYAFFACMRTSWVLNVFSALNIDLASHPAKSHM